MKHSIKELINIAHLYYPRGISGDDPGRTQTEENRRLVDARRRAAADCDRWLGVQQRLNGEFPGMVSDTSILLKLGTHDAGYTGSLYLPDPAKEYRQAITYRVSILVPYYILYSSRPLGNCDAIKAGKGRRAMPPRFASVFVDDTMYVLPAGMVKAELHEPQAKMPVRQHGISFDFSPDEQPYAARIAQEIEATWGYERMPPEVGDVLVPDVATDEHLSGETTLYDCFFSDRW